MNVPERYWRFPTSEAIESLVARFGFRCETQMQDWEYQVADASRLKEFLDALEGTLTDDERFTLSETVMQSFEDLAVDEFDAHATEQWERFAALLQNRPALHAFSLCYWSGPAFGPAHFHIGDRVRPLWEALRPSVDHILG